MSELYTRTEMLIGADSVDRLKKAKVIVFGCGGVGSFVVEALARTGVGSIDIVDSDTVAESNLNRQIIATVDTVGKSKVEVTKARILSINPECRVKAYEMFYGEETADKINITEYDYVCDAIDSVTSKLILIKRCFENDIKIISSMGTGNKLNPALFEITDVYKTSVCPLARVMRRELKARGIKHLKVLYSKEEPQKPKAEAECEITGRRSTPASISFVPSAAGLMIAGEIICDLAEIKR